MQSFVLEQLEINSAPKGAPATRGTKKLGRYRSILLLAIKFIDLNRLSNSLLFKSQEILESIFTFETSFHYFYRVYFNALAERILFGKRTYRFFKSFDSSNWKLLFILLFFTLSLVLLFFPQNRLYTYKMFIFFKKTPLR